MFLFVFASTIVSSLLSSTAPRTLYIGNCKDALENKRGNFPDRVPRIDLEVCFVFAEKKITAVEEKKNERNSEDAEDIGN